MNPKPYPGNPGHKPGIAIVVVISMVTLLTLLVMAFLILTSTNRNSGSIDVAMRQADSIAEQAKETLISDIRGEMAAGSTAVTTTPDGKRSYRVEDPRSMVPSRAVKSGTGVGFNTLVKQSAAGTPFHSLTSTSFPAKTRASNVSTNTVGVDGRRIAPARWGAPKLFEAGATLPAANTPDWIYTARDGSNPVALSSANRTSTAANGSPNPQFVVGRYAYQIYDVSGLLDANIAGTASSAPAALQERKGSLVWADLAGMPGSGSGINSLAEWRRSSTGSQSIEDFIREWGSLRGWMRTPLASNRSDNLFLGRRELIAYQKENPTIIPDALLPSFTIASRTLNQPSWAPMLDTGTAFKYRSNMDSTNAVNRRVGGVRVASTFTRRDGTRAVVGEPLVKNRFPLTKLHAFANRNTAEIAAYFGLAAAQSAGNNVILWRHVNAGAGGIKRLDQVASENREPDFFETLKAALLEGSLANTMTANSFFADTGRDIQPDYQIYRIGASIIDQWDVDDDPTIIQYGATNPLTGVRPDDAAGVENLPYFHFISESRFRRRDTGSPPNDSTATTFLNFQLWNPHKNVIDGKIAAGSFRIAFAGQSRMEWRTTSSAAEPGYTPYNRDSAQRTAAFSTDFIQFSVTSAANFGTPIFLKPGVAGANSSRTQDTITGGGAPVIGYNVGEILAPYGTAGPAAHGTRYSNNGLFSRFPVPMSFALQKNIAGTWVSYQIIPEWSLTHGFVIGSLVPNTNSLYAANGDWVNLHAMLADPRTTRYGLATTTNGNLAINRTTGGRRYDNKFFPPGNWTSPGGRVAEQYITNASGQATVIASRDGLRRPADAGDPFTVPGQRPEILNRPFQSVADMGHAFRDDPWTTLNLFSDPTDPTNPGDGALLDFFGMVETPISAGTVNPNAASVPVLTALLSKAAIREGAPLSSSQATTYATAIQAALATTPLLSVADIAPLAARVAKPASIPGFSNHKDMQVIARALADVANVRTWNLFVDVIAQSGRLVPGATSLDRFVSTAERRYWYHISIDRFTGEVVSYQREYAPE